MSNLSSLIIGPTDKTKIFRYGKIKKNEYGIYKQKIGKVLVENISRIDIIPDDGFPLDIAKVYKELGGKLVVGNVPKGGSRYLDKYLKFCDKIEEVEGDWTFLNTSLSLKDDIMIGIGLSPGTIVEIAYSKYHKKYLNNPIPVLIDERTISQRLCKELEEEIDIKYFNSVHSLEKLLKNERKLRKCLRNNCTEIRTIK